MLKQLRKRPAMMMMSTAMGATVLQCTTHVKYHQINCARVIGGKKEIINTTGCKSQSQITDELINCEAMFSIITNITTTTPPFQPIPSSPHSPLHSNSHLTKACNQFKPPAPPL